MIFTHLPTETVLDRYTIRRGIGVGGFGEVYFAVSEAGKEVALKRIQRNLEIELRGVSHCLNLKHPNLVSIHDICRDRENQTWIVMEYVDGPNLRVVLDQSPGGLPPQDAMRWWRGIAEGVAHLHQAGLVHRDLKPGNVFDDQGTIKVGDYGLSKYISTSHRGGHTESVGTFHYMAPEIGNGQYGQQIDIYALGVILFELLTGEVPFDGETHQEVIVKHLTATPDLSSIPSPYREVIRRCLQKDPGLRPESVAAMLRVIDSPTTAPPGRVATGPSRTTTPNDGSSQPTNEEPLLRAVRHGLVDLQRWWAGLQRSPGSKAVLILATAAILLMNTGWLLPLLAIVAVFYVPYFIVRHLVLQINTPTTYAEANLLAARQASAAESNDTKRRASPPISKSQRRAELRRRFTQRTRRETAAQWTASGATSLVVGGILLAVMSVIGLRSQPITPSTLSPLVWMTCVIWLTSFALLTFGKYWEASDGESLPRRLLTGAAGAGAGLFAFVLGNFLNVPMDQGLLRDIDATSFPASLYNDAGEPLAAAFMIHFGLLFAVLRMWKPVDPLRRSRLSLWAIAVGVVGEWCVHQIVPIPQPAGMFIVGGVIVMSQMSAPWVRSKDQGVST